MKHLFLATFILANFFIANAQQNGIGFGISLSKELVLSGSETVLVNGQSTLKPKEKNVFPLAPELSYFRFSNSGTMMNELILGLRTINTNYQDLTEDGKTIEVTGKFFETYLAHQLNFAVLSSGNDKFKAFIGTNNQFIYQKTSYSPQNVTYNSSIFSIGGQMNVMYNLSSKFKKGLRWTPSLSLDFSKTVFKIPATNTPTIGPDGQYQYDNTVRTTKIVNKKVEKKADIWQPNFSLTLRYCLGKTQ